MDRWRRSGNGTWRGRHLAWALLASLGLAALVSCGGGGGGGDGGGDSPPPPAPVVSISVSPTTSAVNIDQTRQFTATVSGSSNTAVTWSVSGAGCSGASCGTVDATGLYTAPAIVPVPPTMSVTATSQADTSKSAVAMVTIGSDVVVTVWPSTARVTINNTRQFLRTLTGSGNNTVIWSVSGAGCSGADCGSVSGMGLYTAPNTVPSPATVTIRATSVVDHGKSATATISVQPTNTSTLAGTYAYLHRGLLNDYDGVQAGTFTANGAGGISDGVQDSIVSTAVGGNRVNLAFSGSYTVGNDNRGMLSFVIPNVGTVNWAHTLTASGDKGFMQPFYSTAVRGTASLHKQDASAFINSAVNGDYVFQWNGVNVSGQHIANIGRFSADGAGAISDGLMDSVDEWGLTQNAAFTGSYNVGTNGRGTMQLMFPGPVTFNFALYVVSADTLIVVSTDELVAGVPIRIGYALRQSGGPFTNTSLQGTYVFDLAARRTASAAVATVGLMTSNGGGTITGLLDRNDNYVIATAESYTTTYTITASGRGNIASSTLPPLIFYIAQPNRVLLMEASGSGTQTGSMERQVAAPYTTDNLIGSFAAASSPPARLNSVTVTGRTVYDGAGSAASYYEAVSPCALVPNGVASGVSITVSSAGRIDTRDASNAPHAGGYLLSPVRYVAVLERTSTDPACDEVVHFYRAEQ